MISGLYPLWDIIAPVFSERDANYCECIEILLFHPMRTDGTQIWKKGQSLDRMLENTPYLTRRDWQMTRHLPGLSQGDTIEIRLSPSVETDSDTEDSDIEDTSHGNRLRDLHTVGEPYCMRPVVM